MNTDRGTFWYTDQDRTNRIIKHLLAAAHAMDVLIDACVFEGDARRSTYAGYMSKWYATTRGNNYSSNSYWGTYGFRQCLAPTTRSGSS